MRSLVLGAAMLLGACATALYAPLDQCAGPVERVQVLQTLPPAGTFRRCGSIRIEGGGLASDQTYLSEAQAVARAHGANAIVIIEAGDPAFTWSKAYRREGTAIAIRILGP